MAYDEGTAQRLREYFAADPDIVEKKMFGGVAFMLAGNMCCGVNGDQLMARVGSEQYESALAMPYAREMDFTGRALKGFIYVDPQGLESDPDLRRWLDLCTGFARSLPAK